MITITKLRLKNFKSFRNATIPLSDGFTAIAGANGSGKSNIMDAVLFALGETSLKSLRASRLTELVHTGAAAGENYAIVTLSFQTDSGAYDISRMVDKQGKSVYRINEKRVTMGEVQNLMAELGMRVDGHNLVSQGDLMRIIDMNPTERRGLIDEVAGLQEFEEKKNEAVKDLEKVDRRIKDIMIVLNERMAVIEQLGRERDVAKKFKGLEKELRETKATILHLESRELNTKLESLLAKQLEFIEKKEDASAKQSVSRTLISEAEAEFSELDAQIIGVKANAFDGLGRSVEEHKGEIRVTEERIHQSRARLQGMLAQIERAHEIIRHAQDELTKKENEMKQLQEKGAVLEQEINPLKIKQSEALQKKVEILSNSQKLEKEVNESRDKVTGTREKLAHLHARMESQRKETEMLERMIERLTQQGTRIKEEQQSLQKDVDELEKIRKKYPDVNKIRGQLSKQLEEIEHHLAEHTGKAMAHAESLTQLKKTKSNCPICERELKTEHKETLKEQKEKAIKDAEQAAEKLSDERKKRQAEWMALHEAETLLTRYTKSHARVESMKEEQTIIEKEIMTTRERKKSMTDSVFGTEKKDLEESLTDYKKELEQREFKLSKLRDQLNQTTMEQQLQSLNTEHGRIERELYRLQMEKTMQENAVIQSNARIKQLHDEEKTENDILKEEEKKRAHLEKVLKGAESQYEKALGANQVILQKRERVQQRLVAERERERAWQDKAFRIEAQLSEIKVEQSKYETRLLDVKDEQKNYEGVSIRDVEEVVELRKRIPVIEHEIKQLGTVNMKSLEDFGQYEKDVLDIRQKAQTLDEERLAVLDLISSIDVKRNEVFMKTFNAINENFNKLYTGFFDGTALLGLTNPQKPLESGLIIEAKHGLDKGMKNIDSMSGGEKSLTSLAFIFAIQLYEPAPFYFFDEVDAALDMTNSRKVGLLIKEMSKRSQFISITHNDQVVKVADQIVGVAKNNTNSSVIGLKPGMGKENLMSPQHEGVSS